MIVSEGLERHAVNNKINISTIACRFKSTPFFFPIAHYGSGGSEVPNVHCLPSPRRLVFFPIAHDWSGTATCRTGVGRRVFAVGHDTESGTDTVVVRHDGFFQGRTASGGAIDTFDASWWEELNTVASDDEFWAARVTYPAWGLYAARVTSVFRSTHSSQPRRSSRKPTLVVSRCPRASGYALLRQPQRLCPSASFTLRCSGTDFLHRQ